MVIRVLLHTEGPLIRLIDSPWRRMTWQPNEKGGEEKTPCLTPGGRAPYARETSPVANSQRKRPFGYSAKLSSQNAFLPVVVVTDEFPERTIKNLQQIKFHRTQSCRQGLVPHFKVASTVPKPLNTPASVGGKIPRSVVLMWFPVTQRSPFNVAD